MLNLLPTTKKQSLRRSYVMQQLRFLMGVAVVATSCAVIMLFVSDWLLQRWLEDITVETKSDIISSEERTELQVLVNDITQLVNQAQPITQNQSHPLTDLVALVGPTPDTIQLNSYILDYTTHSLELRGSAETRDALVSYQQIVNTIPGVQSAYLPLQDLTSKENIPFIIQLTYETPSEAATE